MQHLMTHHSLTNHKPIEPAGVVCTRSILPLVYNMNYKLCFTPSHHIALYFDITYMLMSPLSHVYDMIET